MDHFPYFVATVTVYALLCGRTAFPGASHPRLASQENNLGRSTVDHQQQKVH